MNRLFFILILFCSVSLNAQQTGRSYGDQGNGFFLNPIFAGEYPDPTILRDGSDYYMTHTSINNYPGLLIWHSTDLVNWKPIAHALNKSVGEIWAPDLVKHNGKFYIYFPARDYRSTMVVTADQITGPWTDPVELKISHIDPGHIVGKDGKRYLFFSDGNVIQLSDDGLSTVGKIRTVYEGWKYPSDWLTECFCLESPKLFKRGKYFYLVSAQGGTAGPPTSHMAVVARSKSIFGPWENSPYNPITHTYEYTEKWWSKGHATLIDSPNGDWWIVYHAFLNNFRTLGRMTLLEPIEWMPDAWFRIKQDSDPVKPIRMMEVKAMKNEPVPEKTTLFSAFDWHAFERYDADRYRMDPESLSVTGKGLKVMDSNPLQFTPGHPAYSAEIKIDLQGNASAGLLLFYGAKFYRGLEVGSDSIRYVTEQRANRVAELPKGNQLYFKILNDNQTLALYYSFDRKNWENVWDATDISPYTGNLLGNFRSIKIALYTYGNGSANFTDFKYLPIIRSTH
jgi:xylan 1,4-beta-xylosidase